MANENSQLSDGLAPFEWGITCERKFLNRKDFCYNYSLKKFFFCTQVHFELYYCTVMAKETSQLSNGLASFEWGITCERKFLNRKDFCYS